MTKLESAKSIIEQNGVCVGIQCSGCCFTESSCTDKASNLKLAKEYVKDYEAKNMVLVSNDKIHWKERDLAAIYEGHFLCHTEDGSYKVWRHMKEIPKTEIWYQYLFKTANGQYKITPIIPLKSVDKERYIRVEESAMEVEV